MRSLDADLAADAPNQLSGGDGSRHTQHSYGPQTLEQDKAIPFHMPPTKEGQAAMGYNCYVGFQQILSVEERKRAIKSHRVAYPVWEEGNSFGAFTVNVFKPDRLSERQMWV